MALQQRTPAMIASLYGNIEVLRYIMSQYLVRGGSVNQQCGSDGSTALHCAASGGTEQAVQAVSILLSSGADVNVVDNHGRKPADVIIGLRGSGDSKRVLEMFLGKYDTSFAHLKCDEMLSDQVNKASAPAAFEDATSSSSASDISSTGSPFVSLSTTFSNLGYSTSSFNLSVSSPKSPIGVFPRESVDCNDKAQERSTDQALPDIKNSFYTSDEFRMYSFKIRPCSRAYSHDWTECPFAHPGENARRRDPRRYHYSCVPCPDFRKGSCSRGDACEYAHGVFECWLHPAQYRTRLCKDGPECNRKVCFFAHKAEELRPVYAATGSGLPSPVLPAFADLSCMSPPLAPCSPSVLPSFSPLQPVQVAMQGSFRTPPSSPSSSPWQPPTVPTLHLPGASLQASRLRAALNARDVTSNDDLEEQHVREVQAPLSHCLSMKARLKAAAEASSAVPPSTQSGRYKGLGLGLVPANLDELFSSESLSSPGISRDDAPVFAQVEGAHTIVSALSPQSHLVSRRSSDVQSPRDMARNMGSLPTCRVLHSEGINPKMKASGIHNVSKSLPSLDMRTTLLQGNKSVNDSGFLSAMSDWGSPTGKPEWGIQEEDLSKLRKSASFRAQGADESDILWRLGSPVKCVPMSLQDDGVSLSKCSDNRKNLQKEGTDLSILGSWMDNLCLDEMVA
ncbi:hypothetical protein KP509_02G081600 [Ceratopteris richardii]|nr:hypothetical protein KP509_02G081600 [Ceratopteris richardii]